MKTLSDTKLCVIDIAATSDSYTKIDRKLPADVDYITGVCFSIAHTTNFKGLVSLRFSEGGSNPLLLQRVNNKFFTRKKEKYIPLHEPVSPNTTVQGYYKDSSGISLTNYTLKIYIEYVPFVKDKQTKS